MIETADPTERIAILRSDLEQWKQILRWVHGLLMSMDLMDNYREGRPDKQTSRLTRLAAQSHNRIEAYLENEEEDGLLPTA